MDARTVIDQYYTLANAGDWDGWCDLFHPDTEIQEQLAGRVTGQRTLREMMAGFPAMYAAFRNEPLQVLVDGDGRRAAVVSHITARTPDGATIESDVMNYFRIEDGLITYMANFHDTEPFRAVTGS
jgi:ketosteroid isomerase-like protein